MLQWACFTYPMKHWIYFVIIAKLCCLWAAVQLFECWSECYYGRAGIKETDYSINWMLIRMLLWQGWYWRDINYSIIWMLIRIWLFQGWYWRDINKYRSGLLQQQKHSGHNQLISQYFCYSWFCSTISKELIYIFELHKLKQGQFKTDNIWHQRLILSKFNELL